MLTRVQGAGSAGSSAAYYLRNYADLFHLPVNITVFEETDHIGGRSTTVNVYDDPSQPVELGASIFVEVNRNLMKAAEDFGLTTKAAGHDAPNEAAHNLGVWDGSRFVFLQKRASFRWWNILKVLWRYGLSPVRTQNLMKSTVDKFLEMYKQPHFPFKSLSEVSINVGLSGLTWATAEEYLKDNWISEDFSREVIQAGTRVNYGQNLPLIHGLEAMVCMATDGAVSVDGGNWQIFREMLKASKATLELQSPVAELHRNLNDTHTVVYSTPGSGTEQAVFDQVVLATPYQFSDLTINPPLQYAPDNVPYVKLYVTIFASPHKLSPRFFDLPSSSSVPEMVLTTLSEDVDLGSRRDGVGPAGFWSISTLRKTRAPTSYNGTEEQYVYKVFSPRRLTADFLSQLLEANQADTHGKDRDGVDQTIADMPTSLIGWYEEKAWWSYPYLYPRVTFEEIQLAQNLWYTSGIEGLISTMETSSLAGKNVAALIVSQWVADFDEKMKGHEKTASL